MKQKALWKPSRRFGFKGASRLGLALGMAWLAVQMPTLAEPATRDFVQLNHMPLPALALRDGAQALPLNPAGAGAKDFFELQLSKSIDPNVQGQFSAFASFPGLSLGYQQFQTGVLNDLRKFSLGYAYEVQDFLKLGVGYHLTQQVNLDSISHHSFDLGAQLRPTRFLSIGAAIRNLNNPIVNKQLIQRSYTLGIGLRPFQERITLTADAQWDEGDNATDITALFGVEAEPVDGILLRGGMDLKGQFQLGLGLQFEYFNAGYFHSFSGAKNHDAAHIEVTNAVFESAAKQISQQFAYLDLSEGIAMDSGEPPVAVLNRNGPASYWNVLHHLQQIRDLPRYKGLVLELGSLGVGLGVVEELRKALQAIRAQGKPIIVYLKDAGMREYYLAALADKTVMHPLGSLRLNGFAFVFPHYKNLLDKLGVEVEFIKVGKYKTGLESFTLEEASDPTQEQYKAIQTDEFERLMTTLGEEKRFDAKKRQQILDKTLFTGQEALTFGLVDQVGYRDELKELAANLIHQPSVDLEEIKRLRIHRPSWEPRDKIAVIYISGSIVEGRSGRDFIFGEEFVGSETIVNQIYAARQDPQVKGLVIRVNSPGGSALASDEIFRALKRFKETTQKPIVVSMGDIAASGGYWIALAGDKVLANPSTITGSIGIYAGKTNLKGLYQKLGVEHTVIKTNPKADSNSDHRPYTEEERQIVQNHLHDYYRIFLKRVSESRKLDIKQVEEVAQGRVYTGKQAQEIQLVDQMGSLEDAIALARQMAVIRTDEVEVLHLPETPPLLATAAETPLAAKDLFQVTRRNLLRLFPEGTSILAIASPLQP